MSRLVIASTVLILGARLASAATPTSKVVVDFNRDILPVLSDNCFACHGPDEKARKAKLRFDTKEGAFRVKDGKAVIVPGKIGESELISRITSKDEDEVMPPPKSNRKLTPEQIDLIRRWIEQGAKWGEHWAFVPPRRPELPKVKNTKWVKNAIDSFILERLEREGLKPSLEAPKETLIRRVTLDLTGLPPTLEEIDAFLADKSPNAYGKVVDRLLNSPRYGERMAWDWLDAARYADSNGYQGDPERTMWPWRDWVVGAMNTNMRYDEFTVAQIAGDLLPEATAQQKLATGFNRNNMHNGEGGRIPEETRVENVFDRVETTATVWLGATFTCCRCHDHKFDPFTLRDYYGLYDIFNQISEDGGLRGGQIPPVLDMATPEEKNRSATANKNYQALVTEVDEFERKRYGLGPGKERAALPEVAKLPGKLTEFLGKLEPAKRTADNLLECVAQLKKLNDDEYAALLQKLLKSLQAKTTAQTAITKVMVMDAVPKPRDTFMLVKGAYDQPTTNKVTGAMPASLALAPTAKSATTATRQTRLDLARWIVSPENPLTARVTVNRYWQTFFGVGIVKTVDDFGVQGEKPSHPALLDWLATEFVRSGWDVKAMHKLIVMSAAYRQSSKVTPALLERDPENRLLARGSRYRMPSWMIRDQALVVSGLLVDKPGGPSVRPYQPPGIWEEATFGKKIYTQDHGEKLYRRSLYTFWRRIAGPTMFFDNAARQVCYVRALRTNTPLQALLTLNDIAYVEAARAMAERVLADAAESTDTRVELAFRLATGRKPGEAERKIVTQRLELLKAQYGTDKEAAVKLLSVGESKRNEKLDVVEHAAYTGVCSLILNLDEAITKE